MQSLEGTRGLQIVEGTGQGGPKVMDRNVTRNGGRDKGSKARERFEGQDQGVSAEYRSVLNASGGI